MAANSKVSRAIPQISWVFFPIMSDNEYFESESTDRPDEAPVQDLSEPMLIALRRVMRAVDLHSRKLMQSHGPIH